MGFLDNVKDALKDAISSQASKDAGAKKDDEAKDDVVADQADTTTADADATDAGAGRRPRPPMRRRPSRPSRPSADDRDRPDRDRRGSPARFETYTVKTGDSLSEIGARFGVPYQEIAKLNNIENPDLIFPGQVFRIPKN